MTEVCRLCGLDCDALSQPSVHENGCRNTRSRVFDSGVSAKPSDNPALHRTTDLAKFFVINANRLDVAEEVITLAHV